jgi:hypothetical protein
MVSSPVVGLLVSLAIPFVSCEDDIVIGNNGADTCSLGQVCETEADCVIEGFTYGNPHMVCGGKKCPAATALWEDANMRMMVNMMDIEYSGDPDIDFVYVSICVKRVSHLLV